MATRGPRKGRPGPRRTVVVPVDSPPGGTHDWNDDMDRLTIPVRGATGTGPTPLAAFDDALVAVGLANHNLIRLSSVIPPAANVFEAGGPEDVAAVSGSWGDRLYAVWAFQAASLLGEEAWAGVAWVQDPIDGRGVFVEHEGASERAVRAELAATLEALCAARGLEGPGGTVVSGVRCEGDPVGALVVAPYRTSDW